MNLFAIVLLPLLAACSAGDDDDRPSLPASGTGGSRTFAASDFSKVELRGSDDVDVRVGSGFSVRAEGDPAVLDKLRIERDGDTLRVGRRRGNSWGGGDSAKVFVTLPRLTAASVAGSGDLTVDRVEGQAFDGAVAGSGSLTLAALAVDRAEFNIAGSGGLSAAGAARTLDVSIAGSGNLDAPRLTATGAEVSIAGSGDVRATVNGAAKVSILGSGDVDLGAGARCEVSKMGSGSVRCGG